MNGIEFLLDANMVIGLLKESDAAITLAEHTGFEHGIIRGKNS